MTTEAHPAWQMPYAMGPAVAVPAKMSEPAKTMVWKRILNLGVLAGERYSVNGQSCKMRTRGVYLQLWEDVRLFTVRKC